MEMPRLNKSVRRVVKLDRDDKGALVPTLIYKSRAKKKKSSSALKPIEKMARRVARSQARAADTYLRKHDRSNEKRKGGWMKDIVPNLTNASDKARKTMTKKNNL